MPYSNLPRLGAALLVCTAIAGCNTTTSGGAVGGGGSGAGGGGSSSYQANFDRVTGIAPTSDMPTSIDAKYQGQLMVEVTDTQEIVGKVIADLDIDVNWASGQVNDPLSGGASNVKVSDGQGGAYQDVAGTLSVKSSGNLISRNEIPESNIGGHNIPATQTGSFVAGLEGDLTFDGEVVGTDVALVGNFLGSGGNAVAGSVSGGLTDKDGGGNPTLFDGTVGGSFYLEQ
ncbi:hypothetical protein [Celeribacter sp.]|uniref:hypothetical protein n=1 Tax=Celeribacter sp. TaxID=1890673 RepID=UPI003A907446